MIGRVGAVGVSAQSLVVGGFGPEREPARTGVTPGVRSKIARRGVRSMQAAAEPIHVQVRLQRDSQAIFPSQDRLVNMGEVGQLGSFGKQLVVRHGLIHALLQLVIIHGCSVDKTGTI